MNFIMKREKMTFNVPPEVRTEIKNYVKLLGFKSESDLCNKAINDYLTKLHYEANSDNINKILVQAVDSTIGTHTDRVSDMLFKLAVSIEKHKQNGRRNELNNLKLEDRHKPILLRCLKSILRSSCKGFQRGL